MKIALACPYDWHAPGGVRVHVFELAERLRSRGHAVLVLAPGAAPAEEPWVRIVGRPIRIPYNRSTAPICPSFASARRVRAELRGFGPDLVHVHEPLTPSTSMFAMRASRAPLVATFHSGASRSLLFTVAAPILRRMADRIDVRVAVSRTAESFVAGRIGGTFEIVPNGVDVERFRSAEPAALPKGRRLLFVGRLHARKGFADAVRAFALLAPRFQDLRLVVVGTGSECRALETLPREVRSRVLELGAIENRAWPPYAAAADVFVAPNVGGESFGLILVEAMAAGLPIVASDIPGFDEVLHDGVEGFLVPPSDPQALAAGTARILEDPALSARMGAAARARAATFSWDRVTDRLEAVYQEAIRRRGRALLP
ncbi:MAG: glycosyltransferase family 4 protein [Actinomycetota bacterium]|nr:glycosyltransferase family 4 protein [Actinomycetota bacterium]